MSSSQSCLVCPIGHNPPPFIKTESVEVVIEPDCIYMVPDSETSPSRYVLSKALRPCIYALPSAKKHVVDANSVYVKGSPTYKYSIHINAAEMSIVKLV
jgi:hypothetical protein